MLLDAERAATRASTEIGLPGCRARNSEKSPSSRSGSSSYPVISIIKTVVSPLTSLCADFARF